MSSIDTTIEDLLEKSGKSVAEVIELLPKLAQTQAEDILKSLRQTAGRCTDAETIYSYSGKTHRFMEKALATILTQVFYLDGVHELSSRARLKRFSSIESRLAKLEERGVEHKGVFRQGTQYKKGDLVSHRGSGWVCKMDTDSCVPGDGSMAFELFVKSGRDGKDFKGDKA